MTDPWKPLRFADGSPVFLAVKDEDGELDLACRCGHMRKEHDAAPDQCGCSKCECASMTPIPMSEVQ